MLRRYAQKIVIYAESTTEKRKKWPSLLETGGDAGLLEMEDENIEDESKPTESLILSDKKSIAKSKLVIEMS